MKSQKLNEASARPSKAPLRQHPKKAKLSMGITTAMIQQNTMDIEQGINYLQRFHLWKI